MPRRKAFQTARRNATFGEPEMVDAQGRQYKAPSDAWLKEHGDMVAEFGDRVILDMKIPVRRPREARADLPETDTRMTFFLPEVLEKKNFGNAVMPAARGTITELYMVKGSNCGLAIVYPWLWVGQAEDNIFKHSVPSVRQLTPRV
tara:strand:- start:1818 stop:2255 length:438 start_codon:yes stop_codon:yes gene_type:complete